MQISVRKALSVITSVFLIMLLICLFVINDYLLDSAYNHVNEYSEKKLLFSNLSDNSVYKAAHFSLPINVANISLWGDKSKKDTLAFVFFILTFIVFSVVIVTRSKKKILYQVPLGFLIIGVSYFVFDVKSAPLLLLFNFIFYGFAIYLVYVGLVNRILNIGLFGGVLWLLPNLYQIMFLEGLYI
ncbi:MAG: hypothetical protein GY820_08485 [Gammaproteobacteria bacterium]|nr:hypothetical protein [Gammaproteobacteria bacterium]